MYRYRLHRGLFICKYDIGPWPRNDLPASSVVMAAPTGLSSCR